MWNKILVAITAAVLIVLLVDRFQAPVQADPQTTIKIGVVDFSKAAKEYRKYKRIKRRLEYKKKKIQKELNGIKEQIQALLKELKVLNKKSDLFKKKKQEALELQTRFKYQLKTAKEEFREEAQLKTRDIMRDLESHIEAYGKVHGFHMIIRRYLPIDDKDMVSQFNTVVYHSQAIDITDAIIKRMNKK